MSEAREHSVLVQAHCPSRFRYKPKTTQELNGLLETHDVTHLVSLLFVRERRFARESRGLRE